MPNLPVLRDQICALLHGGQAYETFDDIIAEFPADKRGIVPPMAEHSAWQVLEHMRLAQRDILDYIQNEDGSYKEKKWPDDYWEKDPNPPSATSWEDSVKAFHEDRDKLEELVRTGDLFAKFAWAEDHTLLREAVLAADHNSYHLGQLVMLRRLLA
jgi:hypothetical protein